MNNKLIELCRETSIKTGYKLENIIEFAQGLIDRDIEEWKVIEELKCVR
jgi:hypothetical protein